MVRFLIPRMVLVDLIKVTALASIAMSSLLMMGGAMFEAARQGLDPVKVLAVMPYLIPPTLPYTLPTCALFACTFVYGRMSSQQEITAIKAGGVHVMTVIAPALLLAVAVSGLGIYLTDQFIPSCNRTVAEMILTNLQDNICMLLNRNGALVEQGFPYEIYVQEVRGDRLINPIFKHRDAQGAYDMVMQASEASLHVYRPEGRGLEETTVILRLIDGVATTQQGGTVHFRDRTQEMPVPKIAKNPNERMEILTFGGCRARAHKYVELAREKKLQQSLSAAPHLLAGAPIAVAEDAFWSGPAIERCYRKSREAAGEMHLRIVQSAVAIPFILLGCPIGILFQRRDFLHTFFVCFLPIITIYYPLMVLGFNVYKEGVTTNPISLWVPCVVMSLLSIPFLRRVVRY